MAVKKRSRAAIFARIAKEAIIISAGVSLLLFVSFWLGSFSEDVATDTMRIKNEISLKTAEIQSMQARMMQFNDALPIWNSVRDKDGKFKLKLSRDEATNILMELRDQYAFKDIRATVSPIRDSLESGLIRLKTKVVESDINITLRAYTDEQIMKFLDDVKQRLSGIVRIKNLRIARNSKLKNHNSSDDSENQSEGLSNEEILALNEPQLDVSISLQWFGIEDNPVPTSGANPGMIPGMMPGMSGMMPGMAPGTGSMR